MPALLHAELPPLAPTPDSWAEVVARDLPAFLRDHAACEQQAAVTALSLVGQYPEDAELCDRMTSLAAEELVHLRRVLQLLRSRGLTLGRRRKNSWAAALRDGMERGTERRLKLDRLLVAAVIEARSCERFGAALARVEDPEVRELLAELSVAEARHWRMFHELAAREVPGAQLATRWSWWLDRESGIAAGYGRSPAVHG